MYAGIDFGTSNSTVVGVTEQGLVETFDIDPSWSAHHFTFVTTSRASGGVRRW